MPWADQAQAIAAVVGTLVAVGGFVALFVELRHLGDDLRSSARGSIFDMAARIKELFVRYPELRPYFFDGKPLVRGAPELPRVLAIADYFCLYLEQISTQLDIISTDNRDSWSEFVRGVYRSSPVIRDYLETHESWYSRELWTVLRGERP